MNKDMLPANEFELIEPPQKLIEKVAQRRMAMALDISNPSKIKSADKRQFLSLIAEEMKLRVEAINDHIFYIGKLLSEAKQVLNHGDYEPWVKENFPSISRSTANNCTRVYKTFAFAPHAVRDLPRSLLYYLSSSKCDEELREAYLASEFVDRTTSSQALRQLLIKVHKGEIDLESDEAQTLVKSFESNIKKGQYLKILHELEQRAEQAQTKIRQIYASTPLIPTNNTATNGENNSELYPYVSSCIQNIMDTIKEASTKLQGDALQDGVSNEKRSEVNKAVKTSQPSDLFKRRKG